jgi:hypothetical protein
MIFGHAVIFALQPQRTLAVMQEANVAEDLFIANASPLHLYHPSRGQMFGAKLSFPQFLGALAIQLGKLASLACRRTCSSSVLLPCW